jgi:hypothetical protein
MGHPLRTESYGLTQNDQGGFEREISRIHLYTLMSEEIPPSESPTPEKKPKSSGCRMFLHDFASGSEGKEWDRPLSESQLAAELERNRQLRELFQERFARAAIEGLQSSALAFRFASPG